MADSVQSADNAAIPDDIFCPECSYNLRGTPSDYCPECGYSLANIRSPVCRIPWVKRRELGRFRSYWRTVWMVRFRNRRFCEEVARPVSYSDAQAFRWVTVLHAYVPVLLVTIVVYLAAPPGRQSATTSFQMPPPAMTQSGPSVIEQAHSEVWPVVVLHGCFLLFLAAATGAPSYLLRSRRAPVQQRNNTIAMSYYACGPLALTVLPVVALSATFVSYDRWAQQVAVLLAVLLILLVLLAWWVDLVRVARRAMPQIKTRRVMVAVTVPLLWLLVAGLTLVCLPLIVLSVLVVLVSLQ